MPHYTDNRRLLQLWQGRRGSGRPIDCGDETVRDVIRAFDERGLKALPHRCTGSGDNPVSSFQVKKMHLPASVAGYNPSKVGVCCACDDRLVALKGGHQTSIVQGHNLQCPA